MPHPHTHTHTPLMAHIYKDKPKLAMAMIYFKLLPSSYRSGTGQGLAHGLFE